MAQRRNPSNPGQGYAGAPPVYGSGQGYDAPPTKYNIPNSSVCGGPGPNPTRNAPLNLDSDSAWDNWNYMEEWGDWPYFMTKKVKSGQQCNSSQYYSQPGNDFPATRQQCIQSQYQSQPRNDFSATRQQCIQSQYQSQPRNYFSDTRQQYADSQYYSQSRNDFPITSLPSPQPQPGIRSQTDYCQPQTMPSQQICRQSPGYIDQAGYNPQCAQQTLGQPGEESLYSSSPTRAGAPKATKHMYANVNVMNISRGSGNNYQSVFVDNNQTSNIRRAAPAPAAPPINPGPYEPPTASSSLYD